MSNDMGNLQCARPIHPGEVLKDEIAYRHISQKELSAKMGMSYNILNDILNGRRPLTTNTAMLFEAALDIPADSLMRLQLKYNMAIASHDKSLAKRMAEIRKLTASFL
jgi:addiction module HigA family antidote